LQQGVLLVGTARQPTGASRDTSAPTGSAAGAAAEARGLPTSSTPTDRAARL